MKDKKLFKRIFSYMKPLWLNYLIALILTGIVVVCDILNPIVMSKTMKLHPVTIMLGLLICSHFWGIIGMIIATPVVATIKIVWNYFDSDTII